MDLALVLNHQCNLRCRYCYAGRKFDRPMPLDVARRAIDFGLQHTTDHRLVVSFFGGEPMLEIERMEEIADYARSVAGDITVSFSLSTNGTLVDERRLAFLEKYDVHVQVSMDGSTAAQDMARPFADGTGSFAAIDRNVHRLTERSLLHQLVAVMTPETCALVSDSFDYLVSLGVPEIYFSPNFTGAWTEAACETFESAFREVADKYADEFRAGRLFRVDPLFGKMVTHLVRGKQAPRRCGFGRQELAVSPAGNIYPCDRMVHDDSNEDMRLGNVTTGFDHELAEAMHTARLAVDAECSVCDLRDRCSTWCGCAQVETTGKLGQVSPLFCWFERLFIVEADRVASTLFAERNPTFLRELYRMEPIQQPKHVLPRPW